MGLKVKKDTTVIIHYFLDQILPPILRDQKWLMKPFFYLAYGKKEGQIHMDFNEKVAFLKDEELSQFYSQADSDIRKLDINTKSLNYILKYISINIGFARGGGKFT